MNIALVEPQIPPNTGNVARLCAATGCALHLVEPLGFRIDDRELKRAGLDYWESVDLKLHSSLDEFMSATAAQSRWFFSTHGTRNYADGNYALGDFLIFGKETTGLPRSILEQHAEHAMRIPMRGKAVRSLNLSTAVGIVTYSALAQLNFPDLS
ncbi:MAG: tRNA (cytidine(34)-2'-O)-methyltransferase [Candidatus Eremiobacteraeota bacterium]|nr:tRNA (cytidine(34)-2'-O)-methyltransferase [Candidatus Eremiobacteraeota bacterium]